MTLIEIRTVKITKKGQIAIPRDIRDIAGFEEGSKLAILVFKDKIELRPIDQIGKKITKK